MSGLRLVGHCRATQECHADVIIQEFRRAHPSAFDRDDADGEPPTSAVLNYLARVRMEPEPEEESSADENVPEKGAGWKGVGAPMMVGAGYTSREYCDGQTLASPDGGRLLKGAILTGLFIGYAHSRGTTQLLMELALGRVRECTFNVEEIQTLSQNTMGAMERAGIKVERMSGDRSDLLIDYWYVDALLRAAEDLEVNLGSFAGGVRVGPGVRMPRLPAPYTKKKRWRLPDQADPMAYQEERAAEKGVWRQNYSSLAEWSGECV